MTTIERIVRRGQLPALTGYSIPHIYELISDGQFPKPIPLGRRAVGWLESEIAEWQQSRIAERNGGHA
jgi:prophage regulatory protein